MSSMANQLEGPQPTGELSRLSSHFHGHEASVHGNKWDELWQQKFVPWDEGSASPALIDLLSERKDLMGDPFVTNKDGSRRRRRALVPGCGKGYDVLLLSSFGYDAYGLEISPRALQAALDETESKKDSDDYKVKDVDVGKGSITWLSGDFFQSDFLKNVEGDGTFDLLYDYTFLCALPPSMRASWALRFSQLLAPEGRVVCLEFPTHKPPQASGPPWSCPPRVIMGHLQHPGQDLPYVDGDLQEDKLPGSTEGALHRIAHFIPARTHAKGISSSGVVTDYISVWRH